MKIYIAGPMRGKHRYNYDAFSYAWAELSARSHVVIDPHDQDEYYGFDVFSLPSNHNWSTLPPGFDLSAAIDRSLCAVRWCDCVATLPGWENSIGASAEVALARWYGKRVATVEELTK